ncbi:hypothetical protein MB84_30415 (plasmid) [Pandoraea oxalativorans]|uniref:Uncharacterized protein n=2 Tax=Pandoraea oxalativorans TaxID=573737 RepID=A0A0G3IES9_9BURK|nr:hypothetical protein MB84_30345 [Pandoraea oxalativorans]AKK25058.1 hypothetical protein MB84_30415 [Pandoraea oxalativorans]
MRKEIVLTRIAVERAELIQATHVARERLRNLGWVRYLLPGGFARLSSLSSRANMANADPTLAGLLQRYPLNSVASLALSGLSHTRVGRGVRRILQWGGLSVLVWRGIRRSQETTKLADPETGSVATPHAAVTSSAQPPWPAITTRCR